MLLGELYVTVGSGTTPGLLDVAVKLCLSAAGEPTSVAFLRGTGFPAADDKIRAEMNAWRYRPYRADGQAVPVCMAINFVYLLE